VEGGLKVILEGEEGSTCETAGLDDPLKQDYVSGQEARFDGEPDGGVTDGLQGCYMASLGEQLIGGSVTWTGTGMFAAQKREICVEMSGSEEAWCCQMKEGYSVSNVAVQIGDCRKGRMGDDQLLAL